MTEMDKNGVFKRVKPWYCVTCRLMMLREVMGDAAVLNAKGGQ